MTPVSAWRSWAPVSPRPASPLPAPQSRSWSGCRSATATAPRSTRVHSPPLSQTPGPTSTATGSPPSTTRPRTNGSSTARRPGSPTVAWPISTSSSPWSIPSSGRRVTPASSSRPAPLVSPRGRSTRSTASRPVTPPRSSSTMCAYPATASSAARRSSTSVSPACVGVSQVMRKPRCRPSRRPDRPSARRRSVSPVPPRSTQPNTQRNGTRSVARSSRTKALPSCSLTWPPKWRPPAPSSGRRRGSESSVRSRTPKVRWPR